MSCVMPPLDLRCWMLDAGWWMLDAVFVCFVAVCGAVCCIISSFKLVVVVVFVRGGSKNSKFKIL